MLASAVILSNPGASAGTSHAPDITDPTGDIEIHTDYVNVAVPEIDIDAAWIANCGDDLQLTIHVVNLTHRTLINEDTFFAFTFIDGAGDSVATIAQTGRTTGVVFLMPVEGSGRGVNANVTTNEARNTITLSYPAAVTPGPLTNVIASSILGTKAAGLYVGGTVVWFRDSAPNEGSVAKITPAIECA